MKVFEAQGLAFKLKEESRIFENEAQSILIFNYIIFEHIEQIENKSLISQ
jgi:hypothetical protein